MIQSKGENKIAIIDYQRFHVLIKQEWFFCAKDDNVLLDMFARKDSVKFHSIIKFSFA